MHLHLNVKQRKEMQERRTQNATRILRIGPYQVCQDGKINPARVLQTEQTNEIQTKVYSKQIIQKLLGEEQ